MNKVSIILPTFNEVKNIVPVIASIKVNMKSSLYKEYEILVIDDNSTDGTYDILVKSSIKRVKFFHNGYEKGLGSSIRYGIEQSEGNIIVLMDSDFNHDPKYLPIIINNLQFYNCVIGSRFIYGGGSFKKSRLLLSWSFNIFIRVLNFQYITDNLYGYAAFDKKLLQELNYKKVFYGFGEYFIRLLYFFQSNKISILQIPVFHGDRLYGTGNKKFIRTLLNYILTTLKLTINRRMQN